MPSLTHNFFWPFQTTLYINEDSVLHPRNLEANHIASPDWIIATGKVITREITNKVGNTKRYGVSSRRGFGENDFRLEYKSFRKSAELLV